MKRSGVFIAIAALGTALVASEPAAAFRGGYHGARFAGHGWRGGGWHHGWRGGGLRHGWRGGYRWGWGGRRPIARAAVAGAAVAGAAATYPYYGYNYPYYGYGYNYPYYGGQYNYSYNYGYPTGGLATAATAPLAAATTVATAPFTGQSAATGQIGKFCTTSARTCGLRQASYVGNGCSCRVPGGRARGSVTP